MRLDRFSPYHADPTAFGMIQMEPMTPYRSLYPLSGDALNQIAYYFDYNYVDCRQADSYAHDVIALVTAWQRDHDRGTLSMSSGPDGDLHLVDTRYGAAAPTWTRLSGWRGSVYRACDRSQLLETLQRIPEVRAAGIEEGPIREFLQTCVEGQLMVSQNRRWLSMAVHVPPREDDDPSLAQLNILERT